MGRGAVVRGAWNWGRGETLNYSKLKLKKKGKEYGMF